MTWLERINGGQPMQAVDWVIIATHGGLWVCFVAFVAIRGLGESK